MSNVFKKLISKEFGENNYNRYFFSFQKKIANRDLDLKSIEKDEIFRDIYNKLKDKDIVVLNKKLEILSDAMLVAMNISKNYSIALIFYLCASLLLMILNLVPIITVIGLILMGICFIIKTYEFVINKYCFIDAHIIIVYKAVLDVLIKKSKIAE